MKSAINPGFVGLEGPEQHCFVHLPRPCLRGNAGDRPSRCGKGGWKWMVISDQQGGLSWWFHDGKIPVSEARWWTNAFTMTGWWWLVAMFSYFPRNIGFRLSSQLTKSYFSEGWPNQQPDDIDDFKIWFAAPPIGALSFFLESMCQGFGISDHTYGNQTRRQELDSLSPVTSHAGKHTWGDHQTHGGCLMTRG